MWFLGSMKHIETEINSMQYTQLHIYIYHASDTSWSPMNMKIRWRKSQQNQKIPLMHIMKNLKNNP